MADTNAGENAKKIGVITHYYGKIGVAAVKLEDSLKVGDRVRFVGNTTDFEDVIKSIQIEHGPVDEAGFGDEVGIRVRDKVRDGDRLYLI